MHIHFCSAIRSVNMLPLIFGILFYLLKYSLLLILTLFLLMLTLIIGLKLWFEPVNVACKSNATLHGKTALVTGGNSGIGLETARDLARRGARVIIACRDKNKSAEAIVDIIKTTGNKNVEYRHLDLAKFSSVREFADNFNKSFDRLDILVNNAGCAGLKSRSTVDGIDLVMQVNYFGPFLLTNMLLNKLIASKPSRIVIVTSYLHHYGQVTAGNIHGLSTEHYLTKYSNSKLCNVLWTRALAKRLPEGVTVNALHPGVVKTNIAHRAHPYIRNIALTIVGVLFKNAKEGAQTSIHLCVAEELENTTGAYYKDCKQFDFASAAKNEHLVDDVWNTSLVMTGSSNFCEALKSGPVDA